MSEVCTPTANAESSLDKNISSLNERLLHVENRQARVEDMLKSLLDRLETGSKA